MKNALNSVKMEAPKTNVFDRTHDVKLTCNMGELIPVYIDDLVPGDRIRCRNEALVRMLPMIAPIMHRVDVSFHTFFVPNRLLWPNWEKWITNGGDDPATATDVLPSHPFFTYTQSGSGSPIAFTRLMDFMGLPTPGLGTQPNVPEKVSAIPFAAYQMIYNEYYRDENLVDKLPFELVDGTNNANGELFTIRKRAWEADYFTKALPFAQKGQPVDIPLGDVVLKDAPTGPQQYREWDTGNLLANTTVATDAAGFLRSSGIGAEQANIDPNGSLSVSSTTINDLRLAFRLQEWLEKNARGGTRYSELIRAHFGVRSQDARLQRPEYICGTKTPIQISEVLSTAQDIEIPQGNMSGHGISYTGGKPGKYFANEHGYVMTIMSIMPKTSYFQGIPKHFLKYTDPTELYWPTFAHLGEQEIFAKEVYAFQGASGDLTFGYNARYQEYKTAMNRVCTEMRTTLKYWHMARDFGGAPPVLNGDFVTSDPTTRIFAVEEEEQDHLVVQVLNSIMAIRPMPVYGTPSF